MNPCSSGHFFGSRSERDSGAAHAPNQDSCFLKLFLGVKRPPEQAN